MGLRRARRGTGCSWVGRGSCRVSEGADRAGERGLPVASAPGSAPAPISCRSNCSAGGCALELERLQKRAVLSRAVERMLDALLLDVAGLAIDVGDARQQAPEVERSGAELRVFRAVLHDVLEMEAPIAVAVPLQVREWVAAPYDHVADVELVADHGRVGALDEHVVGHLAVDR